MNAKKSLTDRVNEELKHQLPEAERATAMQPRTLKVQTLGPSKLLNDALPPDLQIESVRNIFPRQIFIPDHIRRDETEYQGAEFEELKDLIKQTNGNTEAITVRPITNQPGYDYELLVGTRRHRACLELKLPLQAKVWPCDDLQADLLHEMENRGRASKSAYSRGRHLAALMDSGRYKTQDALAEAIKENKASVSVLVRLVKDAPEGMWDRVVDRGSWSHDSARRIVAGYSVPGFATAVSKIKGDLNVLKLQRMIRDLKAGNNTLPQKHTKPTVAKSGDRFVIKLQDGLSERDANEVLRIVEDFFRARGKS